MVRADLRDRKKVLNLEKKLKILFSLIFSITFSKLVTLALILIVHKNLFFPVKKIWQHLFEKKIQNIAQQLL